MTGEISNSASGPSAVVEILGTKKLNPTTGAVEGGEGRIVRLAQPIKMHELETRIKQHLGLATSTLPSNPKIQTPVRIPAPSTVTSASLYGALQRASQDFLRFSFR